MALKFKSVFRQLQKKIIYGQWPEGYKIPTEMELCHEYGVSRVTIRRALDGLVKRGYLVRTRGRGSYVQFQRSLLGAVSLPVLDEQNKGYYKILERKRVVATHVDVDEFDLSAETGNQMMWHLKTLHLIDEVPTAISDYYVIEKYGSFIPTLAEVGDNSFYDLMTKHHGQECRFTDGKLAAIMPSAQTLNLLGLERETAALWCRGYCSLENNRRIGRCSKVFNSMIYEFVLDGKDGLYLV